MPPSSVRQGADAVTVLDHLSSTDSDSDSDRTVLDAALEVQLVGSSALHALHSSPAVQHDALVIDIIDVTSSDEDTDKDLF
jgi:hypothetical protein